MKKRDISIGLLLALALAALSFFASKFPDGLERVAENNKFIVKAVNYLKLPAWDYSNLMAASIGVLLVFFLAAGIARMLKRK